jgi:hypothetical protein
MKISEIPFEITDWSDVEPTRHAGLSGEWSSPRLDAI